MRQLQSNAPPDDSAESLCDSEDVGGIRAEPEGEVKKFEVRICPSCDKEITKGTTTILMIDGNTIHSSCYNKYKSETKAGVTYKQGGN